MQRRRQVVVRDLTARRRLSASSVSRYRAQRLCQIGSLQREIHERFQESELVAGVVPDAGNLARIDRPVAEQAAQSVGQLDLAGPIARGRFERRERCRASACSGR